jgi:16S rRNA (guanine527-N7)-methyltransferase
MTLAQKLDTVADKPETLLGNLERYRDLLLQWNRVHNLSGYKDAATIEHYLFDALYPVTFLPEVETAMDIGTGAGFPGLILAMAQPRTHWTLVEPLQKRSGFLQFVKASLGLENVTVAGCRVEALPPQRFDLITSRAVTDTQMLLRLSEPFRDDKTMLLFYKGENVYNEIPETLPYRIIETEERHYLLINPPKENECS